MDLERLGVERTYEDIDEFRVGLSNSFVSQ
jgi:hypothetical protein